jgi:hypothetical protein
MLNEFPPDADLAALNRLKQLERLLDRQFSFGGIQFGIDSLVGLVPVVGDLVTGALGLYVISEARRIGVSRWTMARMYTNWGLDVTVGAVPIVGDLFDLAFKSNTKNVRLLIDELEKRAMKTRRNERTAFGGGDIIEHAPLEERVQRSAGKPPTRAPNH